MKTGRYGTLKPTKVGQYTVYKDKQGYTQRVVNAKGKSGKVYIVQRGGKAGFTVINEKNRKLAFGRTESTALKKAVAKGKRVVQFLD